MSSSGPAFNWSVVTPVMPGSALIFSRNRGAQWLSSPGSESANVYWYWVLFSLSAAAGSGARLTRTLRLDRWAGNRAIGTEHATIAPLRPQRRTAAGAGIEKLADIGRHDLRFRGGAMRTGDDGSKGHGSS